VSLGVELDGTDERRLKAVDEFDDGGLFKLIVHTDAGKLS